MIKNENLIQTVLTGVIQENDLNNEITPAEQALNILLADNVISFDEEQFKEFKNTLKSSNKFVLNQSIKKGNIDLQTELFFNKQGNLMKNYEIKGNITNLGAIIVDKHKVENINLSFKIKENIPHKTG